MNSSALQNAIPEEFGFILLGLMLALVAYAVLARILRPNSNQSRFVSSVDIVGRHNYSKSGNMSKISIGGMTFTGNNLDIVGGRITVDGVDVTDQVRAGRTVDNRVLEIRVLEGTIGSLTTDASVNCNDVAGDVKAGGSVNCNNVGGDVATGGSVTCDNVGGSIKAGGSVICG